MENLDVATNLTALLVDIGSNEWAAMQAEFKLSINAYLKDLLHSPVHSLADIIAFNNAHPVEASVHTKAAQVHLPSLQSSKHYTSNLFTCWCRRG